MAVKLLYSVTDEFNLLRMLCHKWTVHTKLCSSERTCHLLKRAHSNCQRQTGGQTKHRQTEGRRRGDPYVSQSCWLLFKLLILNRSSPSLLSLSLNLFLSLSVSPPLCVCVCECNGFFFLHMSVQCSLFKIKFRFHILDHDSRRMNHNNKTPHFLEHFILHFVLCYFNVDIFLSINKPDKNYS